MQKALIILADGFEDIEAVTSMDILRRAAVNVTAVGLSSGPVKAANGTVVVPDGSLPDSAEGFDAVVLPGGSRGAQNLARSKKVSGLIMEAFQKKRLVAAICAAPAVVLSPLGILKGRSATCYPSFQKDLDPQVKYREDAVVLDGNILTSRGPATAFLFALSIVECLVGKEVSEKIRKGTLLNEVLKSNVPEWS